MLQVSSAPKKAEADLRIFAVRALVVLEHAEFPLKLGNLLLNGLPLCILRFSGLGRASGTMEIAWEV